MPTNTIDWLLRNARLSDDTPLCDLALSDGQITSIVPSLTVPSLTVNAAHEWDLAGRVVIPAMIDIHTHLDKTYFEIPNQSGTLLEAIELWRANKRRDARNRVLASVRRALQTALALGTTAIRTHVDAEERSDLVALEAILEVKEEFRHAIDMQIVSLGFAGYSAESVATMQAALRLGADFVGGVPALETDPEHALRETFALAERTGKPIDLHIDETEDPTMRTLERLADLTLAHAMQGQVSAGHCCSLDFMDDGAAQRIIEKVARAQINIFTLPSCNLVLMGRKQQPVPRGVTHVKELLAAGINVCAASDNVRDPFNPLGNYDLLHSANLTAHTAHMTGSAEIASCLQMVSSHPARAMGWHNWGIFEGAIADLVVVDAQKIADLVPTMPARLGVFKRGKLVAGKQ